MLLPPANYKLFLDTPSQPPCVQLFTAFFQLLLARFCVSLLYLSICPVCDSQDLLRNFIVQVLSILLCLSVKFQHSSPLLSRNKNRSIHFFYFCSPANLLSIDTRADPLLLTRDTNNTFSRRTVRQYIPST